MRYWWVNHKKTYRQEIEGQYIWSPKATKVGSRNQTYDNLRLAVPGDVVFSYAGTRIKQVGVVSRPAVSCPKPESFGSAGQNWQIDGWMVPVSWRALLVPLRPKDLIDELRPLLPVKHSPIASDTGNGRENVYLAAISTDVGDLLIAKMGGAAAGLIRDAGASIDAGEAIKAVEDALEAQASADLSLDETTRKAIIASRRGQGRFRVNVEAIEKGCRLTGVTDPRLLKASHIKPWRSCNTGTERLDGNNGLLLTPNADHLFDHGYISFDDNGQVLVSPLLNVGQVDLLGVATSPPPRVAPFNAQQAKYLAFHRQNVFLRGE